MMRRVIRGLGALTFLLVGLAPARAGDLSVDRERVTVLAEERGALVVKNSGDKDRYVQVGVERWDQSTGKDLYEPTLDVVASPPIIKLGAGQVQFFRLMIRVPGERIERSYRAVVREVAVDKAAVVESPMNVPVFISPPGEVVMAMEWHVEPTPTGAKLTMRNTGTIHLQVRKLMLGASGQALFDGPIGSYVLPGAVRSVELKLGRPIRRGERITLQADTDQRAFADAVTVE